MAGSRGPDSMSPMRVVVAIVLAACASLACESSDTPSGQSRRIPVDDRIVRPGPPADTVERGDRAEGAGLPGRWPSADTVAVGAADGRDGGVVFGEITDVAVMATDAVFVLDGLSKRLYSLDAGTGEVVSRVGRGGEGPEEFGIPRGLAWDPGTDRLFVVDARGSLKVYSVSAAGRLSFVEAVGLPPGLQDACAVEGDTLLVHDRGANEGGVVAVFRYRAGGSAERVGSFGDIYDAKSTKAWARLRGGEFGCSPEAGRVGFASSYIGDVRMYGTGGDLLWYSVLGSFERLVTHLRPHGGVRREIPEGGEFTLPRSLVVRRDGGAVLQVARKTRESDLQGRPYAELVAYRFSPDGEGEYLGPSRGTYWHLERDLAVASEELPYPRVLVMGRE